MSKLIKAHKNGQTTIYKVVRPLKCTIVHGLYKKHVLKLDFPFLTYDAETCLL